MAIQSVEPNVAYMINSELKSYKLDIKMEQESLNSEIDNALQEYASKGGGKGGNKPDAKLLLQDKSLNFYPVLIEYKGYEDKLEKLDTDGNVENRTAKNEPNFKNIKEYAVNGAIHYANALLHHTSYTDIIAIGVTGFKDNKGKLQTKIGVYYVSKSNLGIGQKVGDFSDLSFLKISNFDEFAKSLKYLNLSYDELEKIKQKREKEIDASLVKLNKDIYEKGIGENDRVYLVAASIIATLGIPGKVAPLEKHELKSSPEQGNTDGEILTRKIKAFLDCKSIPTDKKDLIIRTLSNTILSENINKVTNGETQLKRLFSKIVDDLGIYYKIGLTTDFTGKLFNQMYSWLGFSQDKQNDVVLTPSYVATLLVRLARVNKDSYVWDFATGSAGLLVAAMNEMIKDAKDNIKSPEEFKQKELKIKAEQLLGLEILPSIYMLAVLNMIMMGDGSSNILNKDSLSDFSGEYGFGNVKEKFPATAFVLNPPYSAPGNGMVFVETALSMMSKGYAAIIIQNSAGNGKAKEINKKILERNTLVASIKMPTDLFFGKSNVQTNIYVFKVGEKHEKDEMVKFIDFSKDGYTRSNRKKASNNLKDTDNAKERYDELVNLVRFGKSKLIIFSEDEYYEDTIDPNNGADWNKSRPVDTIPTLIDFKRTVGDYLSWEVLQILKKESPSKRTIISQRIANLENDFKAHGGKFKEYRIGDLFDVEKTWIYGKNKNYITRYDKPNINSVAVISGITTNNGVNYYTNDKLPQNEIFKECLTISTRGEYSGTVTYHSEKFVLANNILAMPMPNWSKRAQLFIATAINALNYGGYSNYPKKETLKQEKVILPTKGDKIDFLFMENFIEELEREYVKEKEQKYTKKFDACLAVTGLKNYELTDAEKSALTKFDEFSRRGGVAKKFKIGDLFLVVSNPQLNKESFHFSDNGEYPYFTRTVVNNGIAGYVDYLDEKHKINGNSLAVGMLGMQFFYMKKDFYAGQFTKTIYPKFDNFNKDIAQYFICWLNKKQNFYQSHLVRDFERLFNETKILLPISEDGKINYKFIKDFIKAIEKLVIKDVVLWADKKIEATKKVVNKAG